MSSTASNGRKISNHTTKWKQDLLKLPREELVSKITHLQSRVEDLERKLAKHEKNANFSTASKTVESPVLSVSTLTNGTVESDPCEIAAPPPDGLNGDALGATVTSSSQEEKFRQQQIEASRRENVLVMRLTTKEQEVQEYLAQLEELRTAVTSGGNIKNSLLDPAVNSMFQRMKVELEQTKEKLSQSEQEFDAWKFTPESVIGKRLMAKCRMLIQENEELGKITTDGRIAILENELSMSRKICEDLKNSKTDIDAFLLEMDKGMEGMQSTVASLQRRCDELTDDNAVLRRRLVESTASHPTADVGTPTPPSLRTMATSTAAFATFECDEPMDAESHGTAGDVTN